MEAPWPCGWRRHARAPWRRCGRALERRALERAGGGWLGRWRLGFGRPRSFFSEGRVGELGMTLVFGSGRDPRRIIGWRDQSNLRMADVDAVPLHEVPGASGGPPAGAMAALSTTTRSSSTSTLAGERT